MYAEYESSVEPGLKLFAEFAVPPEPRPLLLAMHGWHGQVKRAHADNVADGADAAAWFVIRPEMRGRGDSGGRPDCNGWELQDAVDAVEHARRSFADRIRDPHLVRLTGGSGGGGNVMGLVGKFPDYFSGARAECGIGDYGLWYRHDAKGEFRDEMDVWVGCSPDADPEAYAGRSGAALSENLCTPVIVFHGDRDKRVPVEQSRAFVDAVRRSEKGHLLAYYELKGVGDPGHYGGITPAQEAFRVQTGAGFLAAAAAPVTIPDKGRFMVGGYLKTRRFEVVLESVNRLAEIIYDLDKDTFTLHALKPVVGQLRLARPDGGWDNREIRSC